MSFILNDECERDLELRGTGFQWRLRKVRARSLPGNNLVSVVLTRLVTNTGNGVAMSNAMRIELISMHIYAVRCAGT